MSTFTYRARTAEGEDVGGTVRASTVGGARAALLDRNLEVETVEERRGLLRRPIGPGRVKRAEVMHLSRQLGAFVRTGVPLLKALEVLAEESPNPAMRRTLYAVVDSLAAGWTLSEALAVHRRVFPPYIVAAVRSAELTGRLDTVLDQTGRYMGRDLEARSKVRAALTYPMVILGLSVVTVVVLSGFVLPRFRSFFDSFDATLPVTTRVLLASTDFVGQWWWAIVIGAVASSASVVAYGRTARGRGLRDRIVLRVPILGRIVRLSLAERFCRMLGSMLSAGVSLPEAMSATADGSGNSVYARGLLTARDEMIRGDGFARPIARTGLFPGAVNQIVRVGEDTGSLDDQLESAAAFYELELDFTLKRTTTLFEPAAIIVMALMVGFVALAMVQAMYGVLTQVGGG